MARENPVARDARGACDGGDISVGRRRPPASAVRGRTVTHSHAVLAFHTGGRARVEQDGEWELEPGDVLLVPAGARHRTVGTRGHDAWALSVSAPSLAAAGAGALLAPFERVRDGAAPVVRIPAARHAFLDGLFHELDRVERDARGASETRYVVRRSLLTLVLNEVDRAANVTAWAPLARASVVTESLRHIERRCLGPLSLLDVAAAVGRSPSYVTTALKHATGRSAVQWIVAGRMAEARRLLLHSDERIDVIAERVGYADPTHFIRMFRREHGCTPSRWRRTAAPGDLRSSGRPR
jgi:AraC family transcriptional regulator, transcriptional activator of pobA